MGKYLLHTSSRCFTPGDVQEDIQVSQQTRTRALSQTHNTLHGTQFSQPLTFPLTCLCHILHIISPPHILPFNPSPPTPGFPRHTLPRHSSSPHARLPRHILSHCPSSPDLLTRHLRSLDGCLPAPPTQRQCAQRSQSCAAPGSERGWRRCRSC